MESRIPSAKYVKALSQAERLAAAAGYDSLLAAVKDVCDPTVVSHAWFEWSAKDSRGLSKPTNVVLAYKQSYNTQSGRYQTNLVGVALYGKFQGIEPADSDSDDPDRGIAFESGLQGDPAVSAQQLNEAVRTKHAAIVEILCRRNNAMSRGVGQLLVQHCVMRTLTYTMHALGAIFANLVRSNRYDGQAPVESHYAAAAVFRACGFRNINTVRFRAQGAGDDDPGTTEEQQTGRWYALAGEGWVNTFAEPLITEMSNVVAMCPVTPRVRAPLARC
jgi:hypothetical protein